jgi:hypothetical protein
MFWQAQVPATSLEMREIDSHLIASTSSVLILLRREFRCGPGLAT